MQRTNRYPSVGLAAGACIFWACGADPGRIDSGGDSAEGEAAISTPTAKPGQVTLSNHVTLRTECPPSPTSVQISFGQTATHPLLGYGANIFSPRKTLAKTKELLAELKLKYVRMDYGGVTNASAPVGVSDAAMLSFVEPQMDSLLATRSYLKDLYGWLHAQNITVTTVMFKAPSTYLIRNPNGPGDWVNDSRIDDLAQFYVAYLRGLNERGILPDLVEPLNEADGTWDQYFTPPQLFRFISKLKHGIDTYALKVGIIGPGTGRSDYLAPFTSTPNGPFPFKAVTSHPYFVPFGSGVDPNGNHTIYNSTSVAESGDFKTMIDVAHREHVPFIATEFGGMLSAASGNIANPAMSLKSALDLMRRGASAGLLWDIDYIDKYGLIDSNFAPTPAYHAFKALLPNVSGERWLLGSTDTIKTSYLAELGYAAFVNMNGEIVVGLANPAASSIALSVDFPSDTSVVLDHAYGFFPTATPQPPGFDQTLLLGKGQCPLVATLPPGTGVVLHASTFTPPHVSAHRSGTHLVVERCGSTIKNPPAYVPAPGDGLGCYTFDLGEAPSTCSIVTASYLNTVYERRCQCPRPCQEDSPTQWGTSTIPGCIVRALGPLSK